MAVNELGNSAYINDRPYRVLLVGAIGANITSKLHFKFTPHPRRYSFEKRIYFYVMPTEDFLSKQPQKYRYI